MNLSDNPSHVFTSTVNQRLDRKDNDIKLDEKIKQIESNLDNIPALKELAKSAGGLVNDDMRRLVWPLLLGLRRDNNGHVAHSDGESDDSSNNKKLEKDDSIDTGANYEDNNSAGEVRNNTPKTPDLDPEKSSQVQLDVDRSFVYYPGGDKSLLREQLSRHIQAVLARTGLEYYQGYHDIAQIVVMIFGDQGSTPVLEALSLHYLRDFMTPDLDPSLQQLQFIPSIVSHARPVLKEAVESIAPFYGLSAILTLFAHHVREYAHMCEIMDYILACGNMCVPIYMYAALVLLVDDMAVANEFQVSTPVLNGDGDGDTEGSVELTDMNDHGHSAAALLADVSSVSTLSTDNLHCVLTEMSDWIGARIPLRQVLDLAEDLSIRYPLQAFTHLWAEISEFSVLKQGVQIPWPQRKENAIYAVKRQSMEAELHKTQSSVLADDLPVSLALWGRNRRSYAVPLTVSLVVGALSIAVAMYSKRG